jgi:hypothetical protein
MRNAATIRTKTKKMTETATPAIWFEFNGALANGKGGADSVGVTMVGGSVVTMEGWPSVAELSPAPVVVGRPVEVSDTPGVVPPDAVVGTDGDEPLLLGDGAGDSESVVGIPPPGGFVTNTVVVVKTVVAALGAAVTVTNTVLNLVVVTVGRTVDVTAIVVVDVLVDVTISAT